MIKLLRGVRSLPETAGFHEFKFPERKQAYGHKSGKHKDSHTGISWLAGLTISGMLISIASSRGV
jgi:hypothetical protein